MLLIAGSRCKKENNIRNIFTSHLFFLTQMGCLQTKKKSEQLDASPNKDGFSGFVNVVKTTKSGYECKLQWKLIGEGKQSWMFGVAVPTNGNLRDSAIIIGNSTQIVYDVVISDVKSCGFHDLTSAVAIKTIGDSEVVITIDKTDRNNIPRGGRTRDLQLLLEKLSRGSISFVRIDTDNPPTPTILTSKMIKTTPASNSSNASIASTLKLYSQLINIPFNSSQSPPYHIPFSLISSDAGVILSDPETTFQSKHNIPEHCKVVEINSVPGKDYEEVLKEIKNKNDPNSMLDLLVEEFTQNLTLGNPIRRSSFVSEVSKREGTSSISESSLGTTVTAATAFTPPLSSYNISSITFQDYSQLSLPASEPSPGSFRMKNSKKKPGVVSFRNRSKSITYVNRMFSPKSPKFQEQVAAALTVELLKDSEAKES